MNGCVAARRGSGSARVLLAQVAAYFVTQPRFKNAELLLVYSDLECFGNLTLQFDNAMATWGQRRDPWTQKQGEVRGLHSSTNHNSSMTHMGKCHVLSFRRHASLVRELNLYKIINWCWRVIELQGLTNWFLPEQPCWLIRWWRRQPDEDYELVIPVPLCVAFQPWSYDEVTWHDFVSDACNWMVYAGTYEVFRSMGWRLQQSDCLGKFSNAKKWEKLSAYSPTWVGGRLPLMPGTFRRRVPRVHQAVSLLKDLGAY